MTDAPDIDLQDTIPSPPGIDPEDARMLRELLARHDELADEREVLSGVQHKAFTGMLDRCKPLTQAQAQWVHGCYERHFGVPTYENLWSAGKVPTGRPVETPVSLKRENLPLKPPKKMVRE
jgi:hypothetical protein